MSRNLNVAKCHLLTSLKAQEAQTFYDFFAEKYLIMDWKIYTCGCLDNNVTTIYKHVFKQKTKHRLSRTLSVSAVVHLNYFSTKDQKKVSGDQEMPQSHTADQDQA